LRLKRKENFEYHPFAGKERGGIMGKEGTHKSHNKKGGREEIGVGG